MKPNFACLTKDAKRHLKSEMIFTFTRFKEVAAYQAVMRQIARNNNYGYIEPCFECKRIAQKLGLEV